MNHVKIGVGFGLWRLGMPSVDMIVRVAERAEEWGLDSFWLSDHLLAPSPELDVVATLSLLASRTTRMKLGPSVLLLNLRHPLLVAKSFASLDYLSHGRMVMAVGTGANLADYAACGIPVESRGKRLDEGIEVLRTVWREPNASYHGKFFNFDNVTIDPRPAPRTNNDFGTMDIWVGGRSDAALVRAGRQGDGWVAYIVQPERYAQSLDKIRSAASAAGRKLEGFAAAHLAFVTVGRDWESAKAVWAEALTKRYAQDFEPLARKYGIIGTPQQCAEQLERFRAAGCNYVILNPIGPAATEREQVERLAAEVVPMLRG